MHVLRKIFFLNHIYHRQTLMGIGFNTFYFLLIATLAITFFPDIAKQHETYFDAGLIVCTAIGLYLLFRSVLRNYIVDQRINKSYLTGSPIGSRAIHSSSVGFELDKVDQSQPIYEEKGLLVYDVIFNFYRRTKYGDALTRQAFYTVTEVSLERKLPNLIFDSKTAKKRQFKRLYLRAQRISLEGDFDTYFDTYTPQTYHIDSLSFITPEVMEKLIACKDYDVELLDDRLLVFGPLLDEAGVNVMYKRAKSLAQAINDNIDTYKDNRLSGELRHTDVTEFGRKLLENPAKYYPGILLFTVLSCVMIYLGKTVDPEFYFNQISILFYFSLGTLIYKAAKIDIHNQKMMKKYLQQSKTR